jgi:hypothetical protein
MTCVRPELLVLTAVLAAIHSGDSDTSARKVGIYVESRLVETSVPAYEADE